MSAREMIYYNSAGNAFEPIPSSGGANPNTAASVTDLNTKAAKSVQLTGTLTSAGWTGSSVPYIQSVSISGITTALNGVISLAQSATAAQSKSAMKAILRPIAQATDSITVYAYGVKPTIDLPIVVTVLY